MRLVHEQDELFVGALAWWALLGVVTMAGLMRVQSSPARPELPDHYVRMVQARPRARVVVAPRPAPEPEVVAEAAAPRKAPPGRTRSPSGRGEPVGVKLIGTLGDTRQDLVSRLWETDGGLGDVDRALRERRAATSTAGLRGPGGGGEGPAGLPREIGPLEGGTARALTVRAEVKVAARVTAAPAPESGGKLPEQHLGAVRYCYEKRLMVEPELSGRIELGFAPSPVVVYNDTGDDELQACIERSLRRWTPPDGFDGETTYPVILRRM